MDMMSCYVAEINFGICGQENFDKRGNNWYVLSKKKFFSGSWHFEIPQNEM